MPQAPPTLCGYGGCLRLKPCPVHVRRSTTPDDDRRFYNSANWQRIRNQHRKIEPFCRLCKLESRIVFGDLVDHIVPIRNGGSRSEESNLQTLCNFHHNQKRAVESRGATQK